MQPAVRLAAVALLPAFLVMQPAMPGPRLYIMNCGTLIYNNPETYNLTRQEVKNTNMSVACYLVVHSRGALLFDTGLSDRVVGRPFSELPMGGPSDASTAYFMLVTRTLKSQLEEIGFTPGKIDFLALSHFHGDHVGNIAEYAGSTWLVQKAELDMPGYAALKNSRKQVLEGDHDVFGDGTVILKSTPGHTPGHQSLYVKLGRTGGVVLSGDLYHYPEERALNRMPEREKATGTVVSRAALEKFMNAVQAQLWIEHDIVAFDKQKKSPQFYD
jgi:glyoxylase-like metal-dependent hydrolase (beta-lactamase superfamily II)